VACYLHHGTAMAWSDANPVGNHAQRMLVIVVRHSSSKVLCACDAARASACSEQHPERADHLPFHDCASKFAVQMTQLDEINACFLSALRSSGHLFATESTTNARTQLRPHDPQLRTSSAPVVLQTRRTPLSYQNDRYHAVPPDDTIPGTTQLSQMDQIEFSFRSAMASTQADAVPWPVLGHIHEPQGSSHEQLNSTSDPALAPPMQPPEGAIPATPELLTQPAATGATEPSTSPVTNRCGCAAAQHVCHCSCAMACQPGSLAAPAASIAEAFLQHQASLPFLCAYVRSSCSSHPAARAAPEWCDIASWCMPRPVPLAVSCAARKEVCQPVGLV
jgi:hypothetical protein